VAKFVSILSHLLSFSVVSSLSEWHKLSGLILAANSALVSELFLILISNLFMRTATLSKCWSFSMSHTWPDWLALRLRLVHLMLLAPVNRRRQSLLGRLLNRLRVFSA